MRHLPVESSNVATIAYDPAHMVLEVEYKQSGLYSYSNVTCEMWADLCSCESIGQWLWGHLRKFPDAFPYHKLEKSA